LKQYSAHPREVDHQLSSVRHRVFRSFKPNTLSVRWIGSDHRMTIPSSSLGLLSIMSSWMLFLQLVRALSLQLCVVFLLCLGSSMWSIPIVLENPNITLAGNNRVCHPRSLYRVCWYCFIPYARWHHSPKVLSVP